MTVKSDSLKQIARRAMVAMALLWTLGVPAVALAQQPEPAGAAAERAGGEAALVLPALDQVDVGGYNGRTLLLGGLVVAALGIVFGIVILNQLKNLPVHRTMGEVSDLIYETCKTYLITQGKFIFLLWLFIAVVIAGYYGWLNPIPGKSIATTLPIILLFSVVGILGSYSVAWFGIRVNTYANSRTAFASLAGKPYPVYAIPLRAGMSIGMLLISIELLIMLLILLFVPGDYAGPCFIGFAIGESLGAAALRIAGGIFTKIADIGSDLMKIVFNIKEDDARNPGVIADCTGDNAGDSVGPSADGFETYGVTGVALITFIVLAVGTTVDATGKLSLTAGGADLQAKLIVWIFAMRVVMIITSIVSYWVNGAISRALYQKKAHFDFEAPLTSLVWITSVISIAVTYGISYLMIGE